ncbi:rnase h (70) [Anopheles darlingi]|uniref:Rnase h (70) n=1 Tax=Anopheles darlingi TaxID=43151 RepID=W5J469_ANODA|nr:rnase h (70) [Anopheles darlingi]
MLPATGLFRTINCPFYEKDLCTRPYCHFKHAKAETPVATYSATPKSLLNQSRSSADHGDDNDATVRKKAKLEYIPMPTIAPKYVPSALAKQPQTASNGGKSDEAEANKQSATVPSKEVKETDGLVDVPTPVEEKPPSQPPQDEITDHDRNGTNGVESNKLDSVKDEKPPTEESKQHRSSKSSAKDEGERKKDSSHRHSSSTRKSSSSSTHHKSSESSSKEYSNKERSTASNSSSSSKSRSSSSSSKSSHRDKDKESSRSHSSKHSSDKDKDRHHGSSDKERSHSRSSSSKSSNHSSSNHKSSSKSKEHHKTSSSSSSSSSSKRKSSSAPETPAAAEETKTVHPSEDEIYQELVNNPPSDIDMDSDDDDVMQQCKMIFEEYQPDTQPNDAKDAGKNGHLDLVDMFAENPSYDDNRKKRVAYEKSATTSKLLPAVEKKTNHIQNAIKSVYLRQEIVRKQQEELAARKRAEEEMKQQIAEETRKAMAKLATPPAPVNGKQLSPISSSTFYNKSPDASISTPKSRFTPAVNVLAFQKAKEKIEELRRSQSAARTPAQTASKVGTRVAHAGAVVVSTSASPAAQAPPILEPTSSKISYNVRMQYYGLMVKHCLNIYPNCDDAWDRAQTEELAVMKKCSTAMIYKSSALLTINKLRKEAVETGSASAEKNKTVSHDVILAGKMVNNISWSVNKKLKTEVKTSAYTIDNAPGTVAYKMIYECILTEEQLRSNGFPRPTEVAGKAKMYTAKPSRPPNETERYCSRCSKVFNVELYDEPQVDACNYHPKSTCYRRGFADNLHNCCQQPSGTPGCMYANYHVSSYMDYDNLTGFVKTIDPPEDYEPSKRDVFALDCEMCYTTGGLELTRVTVVDINEKTVYDTLVKPLNRIVDYNTRFSGITEEMLQKTSTTLCNVQAVLLSMFNSETILIGHSLESDFKALKLIHDVVVDTSVLYPHKMGPPKKRALKTLCIENLKKIIQENDAGHDSAEDSVVCIQLIKHYLRNRIL